MNTLEQLGSPETLQELFDNYELVPFNEIQPNKYYILYDNLGVNLDKVFVNAIDNEIHATSSETKITDDEPWLPVDDWELNIAMYPYNKFYIPRPLKRKAAIEPVYKMFKNVAKKEVAAGRLNESNIVPRNPAVRYVTGKVAEMLGDPRIRQQGGKKTRRKSKKSRKASHKSKKSKKNRKSRK